MGDMRHVDIVSLIQVPHVLVLIIPTDGLDSEFFPIIVPNIKNQAIMLSHRYIQLH